MNRTIPEIRERLFEIAAQLRATTEDLEALLLCDEIVGLAEETKRRPYVRKAPKRSPICTKKMKTLICIHAAQHPSQSYMQIATHFGVSTGRVSEALAGKRGEEE